MGLVDAKKDVMATVGAYVSMADDIGKKVGAFTERVGGFASEANEYSNIGRNTDTTNIFPSVNNKEDIGSFLLDVLGVVVGTTGLQQMIGELFTNFVDSAEGTMKEIIKKQLTSFNAGDPISDHPAFVNGLRVLL